jgi:hypothetical protein
MLLDVHASTFADRGENELRRRIDRSIGRALVDRDYAQLLLTDPTTVLEDRGCALHDYKRLRSIRATNVFDFAVQAQALFWTVDPTRDPFNEEDERPLATVGGR